MPTRSQATPADTAAPGRGGFDPWVGLLRAGWPVALPLAAGLTGLLVPSVLRPEEFFGGAVGVSMLLMAAHALAMLIRVRTAIDRGATTPRGAILFAIALLAVALLWFVRLAPPVGSFQLRADDYDYLHAARTRGPLLSYLFTPYNEHLCVGTRLIMLVLAGLDGGTLLTAAAWWCRIAVLVNFFLFAWLMWRLTGSLAVLFPVCALFFVPVADEMLEWFSASQWLIGSALAIVACHLSLSGGRAASLAATLLAVLAVFNYTVSLLGVLLCVSVTLAAGHRKRAALIAIASAGTLGLTIVLVLPRAVQTANYGGESFWEGVKPLRSLYELARLVGDVTSAYVPFLSRLVPLAPALAACVALAVAWTAWLGARRCADRAGALSLVGLVLLVAGYSFPLTLRAWLPHRVLLDSGRYHWWPHLALTLLLAAFALLLYRGLALRMGERVARWAVVTLAVAYGAALLLSHGGGSWP